MKKASFIIIVTSLVGFLLFGMTAIAKTSFSDVRSDYWAKDAIDYLVEKKIINGYPNGKFGPEDTIRRVDAARMMVRALGLNTTNPSNPNFKDVKRGSDGFNEIAAAVEAGIFKGTNGYFYPNRTLSRAEMAAIINRSFDLEQKTSKVSFKDVTTKHWAYKDIQVLVAHEISTGYPNNTFGPDNAIKRAEFATLMAKVMKLSDPANGGKNPGDDSFKVIDIY
ncbi:S-layer homology domain-containing protein [Robertmurraya andreesenii]|uniref:SLH domain-containing protein n=1 Tax=Anoxybacillus andreesenii TaxID=1325932 RepID=A0ABT9UZV6_9BACL|nr:S-layer homology domain-containing protein [Robertmurraya andreesenii]MDQ0154224.1 hypothetical protein [Robertmurraya andreesenii]